MHFATPMGRLRLFRPSLSSLSFMGVAASKMRASNPPRVPTFLLYASVFVRPHKQKSNGMRPVDWNSSLVNHSQSDTCLYEFFSCNDRYYRLSSYWPFLVNHSVYQEFLMSSWSKLQIHNKSILLSKICPIFNTLIVYPLLFSYLLTYLLTNLFTYSMEQSPSWEANRVCS